MTDFMDTLTRFRCPNCTAKLMFWLVRGTLFNLRTFSLRERGFFEHDPLYTGSKWDRIACPDCLLDLRVTQTSKFMVEISFWGLFLCLSVGPFLLIGGFDMFGPPDPVTVESVQKYLSEGPSGPGVGTIMMLVLVGIPVSYFMARVASYRFVKLERLETPGDEHPALRKTWPRR